MKKVIAVIAKVLFGKVKSTESIMSKFLSVVTELESHAKEQGELLAVKKEEISKLEEEANAHSKEIALAQAQAAQVKAALKLAA